MSDATSTSSDAAAQRALAPAPTLHPAHEWVVEHDDRRLFIVLYIGLALLLSIWISLFWLVVMVGVHLLFELVRQSHLRRRPAAVLAHALWEIKLDIGLVLLSLVFALYMEVVVGVLGLNAAARLGSAAKLGARGVRFAAWERTLRGILLAADDAVQVLRLLASRGRRAAPSPAQGGADAGETAPAWGLGDWLSVGLVVVSLALLLVAPWLTGQTPAQIHATLLAELQPFPVPESAR